MTPEVMRRGSAFLLLVVLVLLGMLIGLAWRRSHPARDRPRLSVTFLNVGDGDCTLVQSPDGRTILLDTGTSAAAPALAVLLRERNIQTIDLLILCSPADPSIGGVPALLGSGIKVSQVRENGVADVGQTHRAALEAIRQRHIPSSAITAGDTIQVGEQLFLSALWPPDTETAAQRDPLICRINYGSTAFILEAAATPDAENGLISQAGPQVGCTGVCTDLILQVPASVEGLPSAEMLRRSGPTVAVFSCGLNTAPDETTLHRLQAAGAAVWRTDTQGTITVTTGGRVSPVVTAEHL